MISICNNGIRGDSDRIYLTGFSWGAQGVWDLFDEGSKLGGLWKEIRPAALWPVDVAGAKDRKACIIGRIWLHFGEWGSKHSNENIITKSNYLDLEEAKTFWESDCPEGEKLYTNYTRFHFDHTVTCQAAYADRRVYKWCSTRERTGAVHMDGSQ